MAGQALFVLNGSNLNMLGLREPHLYGTTTLAEIDAALAARAAARGADVESLQSNLEGALVDAIHHAGQLHAAGQLAGVVLNAGAYTHTSVALLDAIKGTGVALIELHISNVHARESFRHHSYIASAAKAVMCGFGVKGYGLAIDGLAGL